MDDLAGGGLYIAAAGLLGLVVGSFLNVVIHRLPIMLEREWREQCRALFATEGGNGTVAARGADPAAEGRAGVKADGAPGHETTGPLPPSDRFDLVRPRSACPRCSTPIKPWHNVPVFGWLWLRGRCAACGEAISVRYPLVELFTGLLSALVLWRLGPVPAAWAALLLVWALVALAAIDLDHHLLPDAITLPLIWAGLLFQVVAGEEYRLASLQDAVIGAAAGYLSLWTLYHGFRLATGKEGMGYGDFKLFAALGAWLGWQMLPLIILLSAVVGAAVGVVLIVARRQGRDVPIPFGPYLAAAGLVALLWGPELVTAYLGTLAPPG